MRSRPIVTLALALAAGGCATIISGSNQTVTVNSNVTGAEVYLNERLVGTTPLTASLPRGETGILSVRAPGYNPYQIALNKKINNVFWVNIFIGGTFGSSTDYATGAMYEYEPSTYMVSLQPTGQGGAALYRWQRREGLRGYLLLNGEALLSDLAAGEGEHVDVLAATLAVEAEERPAAIRRWRAAYASSRTAADFAGMIVDELE
jgi:hypothetical protein